MKRPKGSRYRFRRTDGGVEYTLFCERGKYAVGDVVKKTSKLDGSEYTEVCVAVDSVVETGRCVSGLYPMVSTTHSCQPWESDQFNALASQQKIPGIHYNERGDCVISSRSAYRKWNSFRGVHHNNGGYSDG